MGDLEYYRDFGELEKRIRRILSSDIKLSLTEVKNKDFSGKDKVRDWKPGQALEDSLIAARGYELLGRGYEEERAFVLDRAAKCIDGMLGKYHRFENIHRLYAEIKEKAAELFRKIAEQTGKHYKDAGYSFLRAAYGYALAGDAEKAKELLHKSDVDFGVLEFEDTELRERVVSEIEKSGK